MADVRWRMRGQYLKHCNCIATCPCDTVGIPYPHRHCEGFNGMHIEEGYFGDVRLDGLNWAITYHFPGPLHEGNGTVQPFVDVRAGEPQRQAILTVLSGRAGNPWFQIVASVVTTLLEPQFVPFVFEFDRQGRRARLRVPTAEATVGPLIVPATGAEQKVTVRLPEGVEYREMEVAQTLTLESQGPIRFAHRGTNANLAEVNYTESGLQA
jgi:hypothetical protein